jgi:hypothetical protein
MTYPSDHKFQLKVEDVVWREVEDELIVLELPTSTYVTLNGTAKQLWEALVSGATIDALVELLVQCYGITSEEARADAESFLSALSARSLLIGDA